MAHQLKVERSKSCGQLFLLSKRFLQKFALVNFPLKKDLLRFTTPSARRSILCLLTVLFAIREQRVKWQAIIFTFGAESRQSKKHAT